MGRRDFGAIRVRKDGASVPDGWRLNRQPLATPGKIEFQVDIIIRAKLQWLCANAQIAALELLVQRENTTSG